MKEKAIVVGNSTKRLEDVKVSMVSILRLKRANSSTC